MRRQNNCFVVLGNTILPYQGEGHRHDAETEVRQGQVTDEDIPSGPHLWGPHDGDQDQGISKKPNWNINCFIIII